VLARRLHLLTKHRVFSGPGFLVAQEVGDAAHGGQVLLTHDAWLELRNDMDHVRRPNLCCPAAVTLGVRVAIRLCCRLA